MKRLLSMGAIVLIVLAVAAPARAVLDPLEEPCQEAIAKAGGKFVAKKLKTIQKCNEQNLKVPASCPPGSITAALVAITTALNDGIDKKCSAFNPTFGTAIGFPGKCPDSNPLDGFTLADLHSCMDTGHEDIVDGLIDVEIGTTTTADALAQKCQQAVDKDGAKVTSGVLKAVSKCRNGINKGKISGVLAASCATAEPKTAAAITKVESKATADIQAKCPDAQVVALDLCNPNATTSAGAAACIVSAHHLAADDPAITSTTLIGFEYATAPVCGDGVKNTVDEECDGSDNAGCNGGLGGPCGLPTSSFACLCLDKRRERVIEHKEADLDNGWTGASHDSGVVEGGGYVVDLYDCDGPGGPDTLCTVGPSCTGAPHSPCSTDAQCAFVGQGACRKERTAVGPHCNLNPKVVCVNNAACTGIGDFCVKQFHGPPLPLAAGGIQVCVLNVFSEDVVGTKNLADGSAAVRLREVSITNLVGTLAEPCPVCGGFCQATPGDLGGRHVCSTDADCADVPPALHCVTDAICSFGGNQDGACRRNPPYGGPTTLFGNPSIDCPPPANVIGTLDILFNPTTTATVTLAPTVQCDQPAFSGKTCAGGANNGATCTNGSECPGASCNFQCFCPAGGAVREQPNDCDAACVGGANDAVPCSDNSECPGGFCHLGDCRPDPTAPGFLAPNEGGCTATSEGHCSVSAFRTCTTNSQCVPPACATCSPSETCVLAPKNCFINSGIVRQGVASTTDPVAASIFCEAATSAASVNGTAGLPGPASIRSPTTTVDTGF